MIFDVRGPYELERQGDKGLVNKDSWRTFKGTLMAEDNGLIDACGCYVFAVRDGKGYMPYYVGQSQHQSLLDESMNPANLMKYNNVLNDRRHGTPVMFFLPLQTPSGRYASQTDGFLPAVQFLEKWLISAALKKNQDLVNNHETKMLRKVQVKGLLNADPGGVSAPATELRLALGLGQ